MRRSPFLLLLASAGLAACGGSDPNHPPVAVDDHATTAEDTAVVVDVLANDSDPDGDPLTITNVSGDGATVADGKLRVTPAANFHGDLTIAFSVDDGTDAV